MYQEIDKQTAQQCDYAETAKHVVDCQEFSHISG